MEGKRKKDDITKNTLLTYFSKKSRNNKESCDDDHLNQTKTNDPETQNIVLSVDQPSCSTLKQDEIIDNELETNFRSNDIGLFTNCTHTDADKKLVLRNVWVPNKLNKEFFANTVCFLAFAKYGGIGGQPLGQLVSTAFSNWKKAKETFRNHSQLKYHLSSVLDADHFLTILDHKQVTIIEKLETNRTEKIKLNRSRLIPIIECVIFCGQQEIALGFPMLAVHRNVKVDPEEVLNELALRPRRVDLLL
ncbi:unnamed protein product [Macrosiphum euphorbiae]|uniref:Uncharacterized protein n=1 Tax=Macrosiphum euphorbiae TaxID=13131 RepID=A0AAV0WKZ2_9HEMI|nr:unnamed protein product [Macrosiphum euphorbiae]